MKIEKVFSENTIVASMLARHFGLPPSYFTKNKDKKSFNKKDFKIFKVQTVIMLEIPTKLKEHLTEYSAVIMHKNDKDEHFNYVVNIDDKVKIGFWK